MVNARSIDMTKVIQLSTQFGFRRWLEAAEPEAVCCYAEDGSLRGAGEVASAVWSAYMAGRVELVQKPVPHPDGRDRNFMYLAIKRRAVKPVPILPKYHYAR